MPATSKFRAALISDLAERLNGRLGRTAVMKLTFFLQELKGVPLGYSYRIYTYGPYDGQVLTDLKVAEMLGAIQTEYFEWDGGSGYAIKPAKKIALNSEEQNLLNSTQDDIAWVVSEFGDLSASDLEVESTVFFVVKSVDRSRQNISAQSIAESVRSIKPHHTEARILRHISRMRERGVIDLAQG